MKNWTIASTLVTLSLGAFVSACGGAETTMSADEPGLESVDDTAAAFDSNAEALTVCDDLQYDHWRHIAALGVAAANELGRWNATLDFTFNGTLQLSAQGLARCKNGCQNVKAILELQTNGAGVIPRHDPQLLVSKLQAFYSRQQAWDSNNGGAIPHDLTLSRVDTASCGYRYWFKDTQKRLSGTTTIKSAFNNKCVDITGTADGTYMQQWTCDGGNDQNITFEAMPSGYRLKNNASGKCFRATNATNSSLFDQRTCGTTDDFLFDALEISSGKYAIKSRKSGLCLDVTGFSTADGQKLQQYSCSGGSNQQWYMTVSSASGPLASGDQARMVNMLNWVGNGENPYIQFQNNATEVSIDPMGTMVDGGATAQSNACTEASSVYDTVTSWAGKCCEVDGKYGKFAASAWNKNLYTCKL